MVVMSMPIPEFTSDRPHVQAFRWLRFGDYPEVLSRLPVRSKFILYAEYVLGAPRQWLSLARPNHVDPARALSSTFGTVYQDIGYYGAPFVAKSASRRHSAWHRDLFGGDSGPISIFTAILWAPTNSTSRASSLAHCAARAPG